MKKVNVAIVGCGVIGSVHAVATKNSSHANLHSVCDIDKERANKLASDFEAKAVYDFESILSDDAIEAVFIALPHYLHFSFFERALLSGKHVLTEKPLTTSPTELYKMIELSERSKTLTSCLFQHRKSPLLPLVKESIERGIIGKLQSAQINFECERTAAYYESEPWRGKWKTEGGGVLINQAIHTIDLMVAFLGVPKTVSGKVERRGKLAIETEDYAEIDVAFQNNLKGKIVAQNREGGGWNPRLTLTGTDGLITLFGSDKIEKVNSPHLQLKEELLTAFQSVMSLSDPNFPGKSCYGNLHNNAIDEFCRDILSNHRPTLTIREASYANQIVLAVYHSTATKKLVALPLKNYEIPKL